MDPLKVLWVLTNSTYLVSKYMKGTKDNGLFFEREVYEAEVEESVKAHYTVMRVAVEHTDKQIKYDISAGNVGTVFGVEASTGDIFVKNALDYETRQKYELLYSATLKDTTSFTSVIIHVKDINDNPPVFRESSYSTEITEEDDKNLPKKILQVEATDGDKFQVVDVVYFLAGQGVDVDDPATGNFAIDKDSGEIFVLKPLDRDPPLGRAQWKFTVFAQDEGGKGLVGFADVHVNLKDINDNAPHFTQKEYIGNVTENSPSGVSVIRLEAVDYDDPLENGNARIKYSIEKNAIEEGSDLPIFDIHPTSGEIKTLICCLDRERISYYSIQVIAIDGGGLKGTGTVTVLVVDTNDSAPVFTKDEWVTEVEETLGDITTNTPILTVSVRDADHNNRFLYSVVDKSGYGADRFTMVANSDGTGSLIITKPLDYEDPLQRNGFRFQIQVVDEDENDVESHVAHSWVVVRLLDINDNAPQFDPVQPLSTVSEDVEVGHVVTSLRARDADSGGRSSVRFTIDLSSDRRRQFHISPDGTLSIHRQLDRETTPQHQIKVLGVDDGYPPQTGTATVIVDVEDVNDNAPRFADDYKPVVPENDKPQYILTMYATDPDDSGKGNGPPFKFFMDPKANNLTKSSFKIVQEKGMETAAKVVSLVTFDRELQKQYLVPVVIVDSGQPIRSSTNTLTVVVGDVNDNPMKAGSMDILAYVHRVQNVDTPIGRIYVDDLDDWDLSDKTFKWETRDHPRFRLKEDTGELIMRAGTPRGVYDLRFRVMDYRHNQTNVAAHVRVRVKDLSYNSATNSGSLRLAGISAVELVRKRQGGNSKLTLLQTTLAEILEVDLEMVAIFSVQQVVSHPPITDVRFAVSNFKREVLDGLVTLYSDKVEQSLDVRVQGVGMDVCQEEHRPCEGSCTSHLEVGGPGLVVNANTTALVGVQVAVVAECLCGALDYSRPESCRSRPCYNGGRCIEGKYGISCSCPNGFKGPRCQKTSRSFNGDSWAWYPPLQMCESSHLSFDFLARKADGQLVYNGPVGPPKPGGKYSSDFISLELVDGYPRLLIDYGSGTLELIVITEVRLNDSSWHHLDILWNTEVVELVVDSCLGVEGLSPPSACQAQGSLPPLSEQLNLHTPLQLGGRHVRDFSPSLYHWTAVPYGEGFHGCIKNFLYNSKLYDLAGSGLSAGSSSLQSESCAGSGPCALCEDHGHGECVGTVREPRCQCHPGYQGPHCATPTTPVTLRPHSYIKYELHFDPDPFSSLLQLRFRTREETGQLFRLGDQRTSQYAILEIVDSRLRFRYRLSDSDRAELSIATVPVNDGQWHHVQVFRAGSVVVLETDGGEGRRGNRTVDFTSRHQLIVDTEEGLYLGGKPEVTEIGIMAVEHDYQEGCIDDVRLNDRPLPLPPVTNSTPWARAEESHNVIEGCSTDRLCDNGHCLGAFECSDPWNTHRCFCGEGRILTSDGKLCIKSDDCLVKPCVNGGVCMEQGARQQYQCVCPEGFLGDHCEVTQDRQQLRLGVGAFATVLGCILIILLVVLVMVVLYHRRRESSDKKRMESDVRENIIKYNDDGGGADDMMAATATVSGVREMSSCALPETSESETSFIDLTKTSASRSIHNLTTSPSRDEVHIYTFEGGGSNRSSLSSLTIGD